MLIFIDGAPLESLTTKLESVMSGINSIPLNPLPRAQIEPGTLCLARYSVDNTIYRAVVLNTSDRAKAGRILVLNWSYYILHSVQLDYTVTMGGIILLFFMFCLFFVTKNDLF